VERLLAAGKAYKCYCSPEELEAKREQALKEGRKPKYDGTCRKLAAAIPDKPFAVRFKSPQDGVTSFADLVKGEISFNNEELDDLIIQRSDGTPIYNFTVVIDDATMGITTVIRGDDHVNNTPRQILIYEALGYPVPRFAHVPMILGADKARLSKRHGATSVIAYREMGYLPEAMVNYLVRLGWSHGDQEIFGREELLEMFSIEDVGKSAGVFNPDKLLWLNAHYIKSGDPRRLADLLTPLLKDRGVEPAGGPDLAAVVRTLQERARTLVEMAEGAGFYYQGDFAYETAAAGKFLNPESALLLQALAERLERLAPYDQQGIEMVFREFCAEQGIKMGQIGPAVRVAMCGGTTSPGIYEVLEVLGKEETVKRLARAVEYGKQ
jgi:glutamyl-tRNA synthetase